MRLHEAVLDAGVQAERTHLSWRRTALSVAFGSLVSMRVLSAAFESGLWYLAGVPGMVFAAWAWWACSLRYERFGNDVRSGLIPRMPDGVPLLLVSAILTGMGAILLATLVTGRV